MPKEKLMSIQEFSALSKDEMMKYTELAMGNSKTEDFKKATGLDFSYAKFMTILKEKGIVRAGSQWLQQPVEEEKTISELKDEVEEIIIQDLNYDDLKRKRLDCSEKLFDELKEISKVLEINVIKLLNLAIFRLLSDIKEGKIRFISNFKDQSNK